MKKRWWWAGILGLCAASFAAGTRVSGEVVPPPEVEVTPSPAEPDWRAVVRSARGSADAQSARGHALKLIDEATGDTALVRGVRLLAPVATADDVPLLESLVRTGEPILASAALDSLSVVATPEAVSLLEEFATDRRNRFQALTALGASGHPDALSTLSAALDDPEVQYAAAQGLTMLGTPEAAAILIERFEQSTDWEATTWAEHLAQFPAEREEARDVLLEAAESAPDLRRDAATVALARRGDPDIYTIVWRKALVGDAVAIRSVGHFDDPRAIRLLKDLIRAGGTPATYAIEALGAMQRPEATRVLLGILESGNESQALQALYLLPNPGDPEVCATLLWAAAEGRQSVAQAAAMQIFGHQWGKRVPEEVLTLAREKLASFDTDIGPAIALMLRYGDREDQQAVYTMVLNGPRDARVNAIWALQTTRAPAVDELLLRLMADPDPYVSSQAMHAALSRDSLKGEMEGVLLDQLESNPTSLGNIATILVQLDSSEGIAHLEGLLDAGTPAERSIAISALMASTEPGRIRQLVVTAKDREPDVQYQIYSSALWAPGVDAVELADRVLEYGTPEMRHIAVDALANTGTRDATRRLLRMSEDDSTRDAALNALARVGGKEAEARLVRASQDSDSAATALGALQSLGTPGARDAITAVARGEGPSEARLQAIWALHGTATPEAGSAFTDAVFDSDPAIRQAAIDGLAQLGTHDASDTLVTLLEGDDATHAAAALQRTGGRYYLENRERIDALMPTPNYDFELELLGNHDPHLEW